MFKALKQLSKKSNKDIRKRVYFTLFALFIFILGINIAIPGISGTGKTLPILEFLDLMAGGAFKNRSILALGVMPYITAEIVMELLQMDIIPYFSELRKQGPVGRQKITKIGRYLGIFVAFIQGIGFSYLIKGTKLVSASEVLYIAIVLTAGTAFLMWLGDQITKKGIGNGLSLLILAGILFGFPSMIGKAFNELVLSHRFSNMILSIVIFSIFILLYIGVVAAVVFVQEAERRVPIKYVNKSTIFAGEDKSFMPFKINSAGVIPVIFASSLLAIPNTIAQFIKNPGFKEFSDKYLNYTTTVGMIIFAILIFAFSYFYTYIQIKPEELSKNLNENGGFIPGVRPGKETENYVTNMLTRITFLGGLFITLIAVLPIIFNKISGLSQTITLGGTGLLIVVGVALETYKQLEGSLIARNYKKEYIRK